MNINLTAPINSLGYGVVGLNVLKSLVAEGVRVSYWPIGPVNVDTQEDMDIVNEAVSNQADCDFHAPSLRIWHQHDMAQHVGHGIKIGMPIFELDRLSENEKHHLASLNRIFVNSEWAAEVISDQVGGIRPAEVVPLGIDDTFFNLKSSLVSSSDKTIFLNMGKWEVRKGHDVLPEIFNRAFKPEDNVELWMMNESPFLDATQHVEWSSKYHNTPMGSKIKILPRVNTHEDVADIMKAADVGVFPSRAEGWNLEALELMACGKHIVISNCSAHTEFCNGNNSTLIEMGELEDAHDGIWFNGQGRWASIGEEQIHNFAAQMYNLYQLDQTKMLMPNLSGVATAKEFSWKNMAKKIIALTNEKVLV